MKPEIIIWKDMQLVRISNIKGFAEWLSGQTMPFVDDNSTPTDWAYYWDYLRFIRHLPIID
jgi:hypothetical protein